MPIQIQEINDENESLECPLCMEPLEVDDINFFPCVCGYQVCRFCWHRIRTDENGLCPACRTSYPENPVEFRPLTESDLQKIRQEKRQKEVQRRQKITDCRRHLASIRVLQKNLVFVVGLSQRLSDSEVLKRQDYFGKYGKILKIVVNTNTAYAGSQGPSASAYITYSKMEEALRAIQSVNNIHVDGRTLKASLGTTKYCSTYLKNQQCHKSDCMYLHELADEESSFTKEDMQAGKHQELEQRLIEEVEAQTEPPVSSEPTNTTTKTEKPAPVPNTRSQTSPWTTQQQQQQQPNSKIENSWLAGMPQTFDHSSTPATITKPSQTETKTKETKNSPKTKSKKLSPRHTKTLTPTIETRNSSRASSECSSIATTPPPTTIASSQNQPTRISSLEVESTQDATPSEPQTVPIAESAVTKLPSSTTEDTATIISTNERYNQVNENYVQVTTSDAEFPSSTLLHPVYDKITVQPESVSQILPDVIPIQSTNDWEAAFGFSTSSVLGPPQPGQPQQQVADSGDNDFGFDPWVECSKGLADLMEKESAYNKTTAMIQRPTSNKSEFHQPFPPQFRNLSHTFTSTTPEQPPTIPTNHFGLKPSGFPVSFSQNLPQQQTFGSRIHHGFHNRPGGFDANASSKANFPSSPTKKMSDWQNGLRALLPSVNINFAMDGQTSNSGGNAVQNLRHADNMSPSIRQLSPRNHYNPGHQMLGGGYDESSSQMQSHSSIFPQSYDRNQTYFQNRIGLGSTDRYNSLAPPPGLSSSTFHNDPAIISSGTKAPMPKQTPPVEETPHWMRSLQLLVETETPANQPQNLPVATHTNPNPSFSTWPSLPNAGTPLGGATQPPPGFQNRLTDNSTMDYAIRQSLLENQS